MTDTQSGSTLECSVGGEFGGAVNKFLLDQTPFTLEAASNRNQATGQLPLATPLLHPTNPVHLIG